MPGGQGQVKAFWESMAGHGALTDHPITAVDGWSDIFLPISLHGDGVSVTGVGKSWSRGVETYSWSSLLCEGKEALHQWLLFLMQKACMTRGTLDVVWKAPTLQHLSQSGRIH